MKKKKKKTRKVTFIQIEKINLSRNNFSNQSEQSGRHKHICSHIDQRRNTQRNASMPLQ